MKLPCIFYLLTGLYCPFCGGTRGMRALFQGKVLLSIHENPVCILMILTGIFFVIGRIFRRKLLPEDFRFWTGLLILWQSWNILRNIFPILQPMT